MSGIPKDNPKAGLAPAGDAWLLVSDVDDTLVGDDAGLAELIDRATRTPGLIVAVNSSRPHDSVMHTMRGLPGGFLPAAVITALGTEIMIDGVMLGDWQARFAGFDRGPIDALMIDLGLDPHDEEMQTPFKASFAVPAGRPVGPVLDRLSGLGVPLRTIVSHSGMDLDVIPVEAGKGAATLHLAERLGVPVERVVVAGDSANDQLMFDAVDKAIAVGNAREELKRVADPETTYFARRACAGGIVEGLRYWGVPLADATPASRAAG